jgi:uncharacterized protein (TIGR00730 family)
VSTVCIYAGSAPGNDPAYAAAAADLTNLLVERGHTIVYGGGRRGLMGVVADTALAAGGTIVGIIPEAMIVVEVAHTALSELIVVDTMHARKQAMASRADAFVALPGGIGTLEELAEVWTWTHLGYQDAPVGLLNVNGYYDALIAFLDHAVAEGFLHAQSRALLATASDPVALLDALQDAAPPGHERLLR